MTVWHPEDGGRQTYLMPREDYDVIRDVIDGLVFAHFKKNA